MRDRGELASRDVLRYGAPAVVLALLGIPLFLFVPPHFVDGLGMDAAVVGALLLLARVLDLVADPLAGHGCRTAARARIMLVCGAALLLAGAWLLFMAAPGAGVFRLFSGALLVWLGWTLIAVPVYALGANLPRHDADRVRLAMGREGCAIVGTLLAVAVPWAAGLVHDVAATLALLFLLVAVLLPPALLGFAPLTARAAWDAPLPWAELRVRSAGLFRDNGFRRTLLAYFLNAAANGAAAALLVLYVTHVLAAGDRLGLLLGLYLAAGLCALPAWLWLAGRAGLVRAWRWSMVWAAAVFVLVPALSAGDVLAFALVCVATGLSVGADNALPSALQARTLSALRDRTGRDDAGLAFGWWGLATKLALAAGAALGLGVTDLAGFDVREVDDRGRLALSMVYGLLPVLLKLAAVWSLRGMERRLAG
ncbi:MAG: MFS transporter [Pseudomonadota bacterium]